MSIFLDLVFILRPGFCVVRVKSWVFFHLAGTASVISGFFSTAWVARFWRANVRILCYAGLTSIHPFLSIPCANTRSAPLFSPSRLPTHPSFSPPAGGAWRAATGRWSVEVKHSANLGLLKGTSSRSVELKHLRAVARDSWPLLNAAPSAYRPSLVPPPAPSPSPACH